MAHSYSLGVVDQFWLSGIGVYPLCFGEGIFSSVEESFLWKVSMLELTEEQQRRAESLHSDALVIDSLLGGPFASSPEMEDFYLARQDAGESFPQMAAAGRSLFEPRILSGDYAPYRQAWYRSGLDVGSYTIGVAGAYGSWTWRQAVQDLAFWQNRFDSLPWLRKMRSAADIDAVKRDGAKGIILNFQNAVCLEDRLDNLDFFHKLGVRVIQLTYNSRNLLGDGCTERNPAGLSKFGIDAVRAMNEQGVLIDVSHCSVPTSVDAIEQSERPLAVTHGVCSAIHAHVRGKPDHVLQALAERGGYFGVCMVPFFLTNSERPSIEHFMAHFNHAVTVAGVEHVGIATDWDRMPIALAQAHKRFTREVLGFRAEDGIDSTQVTEGLESLEQLPNVTRAFVAHGYSDSEIVGFLGGNFRKVFEIACG